MTRTYSFDHYTAQTTDPPRRIRAEDRARYALSQEGLTESEGVHYGRQHAQTELLYRELQRPGRKAHKRPQRPKPAPSGGAPIGALPATDEVYPPEDVRGVVDEVGRQAQAARSATRELVGAGARLVKLPFHLGRLILRKVVPRPS